MVFLQQQRARVAPARGQALGKTSLPAVLRSPPFLDRGFSRLHAGLKQPAADFFKPAIHPRSIECAASSGFRPSSDSPPFWNAGGSSSRFETKKTTPPIIHSSGHCKQFDYIVIGSGIAGLTYAIKVAQYGTVAVITKDAAKEGCTLYAQGGVCAVLDQTDKVEDHVRDTIVAGAYLNDPKAVEVVCREGPKRVLELVALGAEFTRNADGSLHLTREGGHGNRRIVHAADLTGAEIERALLDAARAHPNVHLFEHHLATELVVDGDTYASSTSSSGIRHCFGADVLDQKSGELCRFIGLSTMLACGGAGQVYPKTTNPHVVTGDGIAMAYRAGAAISNMEFIQFHPTALYTPPKTKAESKATASKSGGAERTFLITEAVRGEGGRLFNLKGERFMERYDDRLELAPRDIVARAIQEQMRLGGDDHVLLDISHCPAEEVLSHFPNVAKRCAELGIDITKDPIPVVPAQHYTCGGIQTGLYGETAIQGLFACGEVACSGLHGANRLASNSLLEGLVFADRAVKPSVAHAEYAQRHCSHEVARAVAEANGPDFAVGPRGARPLTPQLAAWAAARRRELADVMWRSLGIVRTRAEMKEALGFASLLGLEARSVLANAGVSTEAVELVNLATVAELIASCALQRKESRGGHYVLDHPESSERERRPSLVQLQKEATLPGGYPAHHILLEHLAGAKVGGSSSKSGAGTPSKLHKGKKLAREMAVRAVGGEESN